MEIVKAKMDIFADNYPGQVWFIHLHQLMWTLMSSFNICYLILWFPSYYTAQTLWSTKTAWKTVWLSVCQEWCWSACTCMYQSAQEVCIDTCLWMLFSVQEYDQ